MGAKGAVEILYRAELGDTEKIAGRIKDYEDRFANPFVAAERGYIDEVIAPYNTRYRVTRALNMLRNKQEECRGRSTITSRFRRLWEAVRLRIVRRAVFQACPSPMGRRDR